MKKYIYIIIFISLIFFAKNSFASEKPLIKDNVLIYADQNGEARGYDLMWKAQNITGTYAQESPIIKKDDVVYVTSINRDGMPGNDDLFALDAYTGEEIAKYHIGPTFGDVTIDGDTLYIGIGDEAWRPDSSWAGDYGMYSFDISNIRTNGFVLNWFHKLDHKTTPSYLIDDHNIYLQEFEGNQYKALDKSDGHEVWSFTKGNYGAGYPLLHGDYIYIANSYQGGDILYKINKDDGTEVWHKSIDGRLWDDSIVYSPDDDALFMALYFNYDNPKKYAISYDMDGNERWSYPLHYYSMSPTAYHNHSVFFTDVKGWIYSFNSATGALEWEKQLGKPGNHSIDIAAAVIANGKIFVGTKGRGYEDGDAEGGVLDSRGRGAFYILDEETGDILWKYEEDDLGDVMSLASLADGVFYNATNAWDVYAFDVGDGTKKDYTYDLYDENNSLYAGNALTHDRYVKSVCSLNGNESTCTISNLYAGKAVNVDMNFKGNPIKSVQFENGDYHIYVDGEKVYMPEIEGEGQLANIKVTAGAGLSYDNTLPRLTQVNPDKTYIYKARYSPINKNIILRIGNTHSFHAKIKNYSRPFVAMKNILDGSSVEIIKNSVSENEKLLSSSMDINLSTGSLAFEIGSWSPEYMNWVEKNGDASLVVQHSVEQLLPNTKYELNIDGDIQYLGSDASGVIHFDFQTGNGIHNFSLKKWEKTHEAVIRYVCKDSKATNYSRFGRNKQSLCEYKSQEENVIEDEETNNQEVTESNPLGGNLCSTNKILHNAMKKGDRDGSYSSYNKGKVTEISLLQSHINRILSNEYGNYAAGPTDGIFGPLTKRGVMRLQERLNTLLKETIAKPLIVDGIVGPYTREAINHSC